MSKLLFKPFLSTYIAKTWQYKTVQQNHNPNKGNHTVQRNLFLTIHQSS